MLLSWWSCNQYRCWNRCWNKLTHRCHPWWSCYRWEEQPRWRRCGFGSGDWASWCRSSRVGTMFHRSQCSGHRKVSNQWWFSCHRSYRDSRCPRKCSGSPGVPARIIKEIDAKPKKQRLRMRFVPCNCKSKKRAWNLSSLFLLSKRRIDRC